MTDAAPLSFYDEIGGHDAFVRLVDVFYRGVADDDVFGREQIPRVESARLDADHAGVGEQAVGVLDVTRAGEVHRGLRDDLGDHRVLESLLREGDEPLGSRSVV